MIFIETSKNGYPVVRKNGRLLDSSIDPLREAATYFKRLEDSGDLRVGPSEQIIVLGIGSGYQVLEIIKQRPSTSVLVVDNDRELVAKVLETQPGLRSIKICLEEDWTKLTLHSDFRDAVVSVYDVFIHGPSAQIEPEYYQNVQSLLRGRDKLSFLHLVKTRPELLALFDSQAIEDFGKQKAENAEAVGLEQICSLFHENSRMSRERRVWRALEELLA